MIEIPLKSRKHLGLVAIVDDEDFDKVCRRIWYLHEISPRHRYAVSFTRYPKRTLTSLHRLLIEAPKGMCVDHIDGDGLNCQKANLRICTQSQNIARKRRFREYSSKFHGVFWLKGIQRWRASARKDGKKYFSSKNFTSEIDAARAYNELALKLHGEYARLNDLT